MGKGRFFSPFVILLRPTHSKTFFFCHETSVSMSLSYFLPPPCSDNFFRFFFFAPLSEPTRTESEEERNPFFVVPPIPSETVFFDFQTSIQSAFEGSIVVIPLPCLLGRHRFKEEKVHFRHSGRAFPLILQVCYSKGIPPLL